VYDWTSHGADALRVFAAGHDPSAIKPAAAARSFGRDFGRPIISPTHWAS
jgi:hypothetical protein